MYMLILETFKDSSAYLQKIDTQTNAILYECYNPIVVWSVSNKQYLFAGLKEAKNKKKCLEELYPSISYKIFRVEEIV